MYTASVASVSLLPATSAPHTHTQTHTHTPSFQVGAGTLLSMMQLNDEPYARGTVRGQDIPAEVDQHAARRIRFLEKRCLLSSYSNQVLAECAGYVAVLNGRGYQEKLLENLRPSLRD